MLIASNAFIIKEMKDEAREEGREETKLELAKSLLDVLDDETIAKKFGLSIEIVRELREETGIVIE